ncbi:glycoside hydrolase family 3 protein [Tulasnella calospora MUT 4182]|uniref:beta-glucosidase n=1 Tax=Tulasnella calospora MUT 4182 TaxID=1051891 RepID=A0A0C3L135_9AGAM|nr:glycoside hydrolase family 3 protein [Tulasnella calospora MUT 4182]
MTAASFADTDIQDVVDKLTTEEAISLISGFGFWSTAAVPRLGVPSIKVTDGPNGVRGGFVFNGTPANCIPCATALAATWDTGLVSEIASNLLAPEVKQRASSVLLAPTCNIQRSPLGGRSFESFAEDPHLSGHMAAAYINGLQSGGVGACIKHFVANDQEDDRFGSDSILSDRALREIYLYPFMLAEKLAKPMSYMTAYNKLNGTHCSENTLLLQSILREEWESEAMVMSDWFGLFDLAPSINAGVDLEMPGVNKWRVDEKVQRCISANKFTVRTIKERAASVLRLVRQLSKTNAEVIDGDGKENYEKRDADCALMRRVAAECIVLLKNSDNILPIKPAESGIKRIAIIGPNAKATVASGGGSAAMRNGYVVTPFGGIVAALPEGLEVKYHEGCAGYMMQPRLDTQLKTETGEPGWICSIYSHDEQDKIIDIPVRSIRVTETNNFLVDPAFGDASRRFTVKFKGKLVPREKDERFRFGLTVHGRGKLYVDGKLVIDNWTRQIRGNTFFGKGTPEVHGEADLKAGVAHEIEVEFRNIRGPADGDEDEALVDIPGMRLGGAEVLPEQSVDEAAAIAKGADLAIVVVGLNGDWETEGYDRTHLELPGRTNELVAKVAAVNPKTVVVNQSGSAVTMPWIDQVSGLVQAWYLGNETGNAIADVLFGKVNPSGKMSLTFPKRLEDVPSYGHFSPQNGKVHYGEDLYVGYKSYHHRNITPLFPFG